MNIKSIIIYLTIFIYSPLVKANIEISDKIVAGESTPMKLSSVSSDTISFTYRPNSIISFNDTIITSGTENEIIWTPERAGIVSISSKHSGSKNVSVYFNGISYSGIFVLILAALILFGGVLFSFKVLLEKEDGREIITNQFPDT